MIFLVVSDFLFGLLPISHFTAKIIVTIAETLFAIGFTILILTMKRFKNTGRLIGKICMLVGAWGLFAMGMCILVRFIMPYDRELLCLDFIPAILFMIGFIFSFGSPKKIKDKLQATTTEKKEKRQEAATEKQRKASETNNILD